MGPEDINAAWVAISSLMTGGILIASFTAACAKLYGWARKPTEDNSEHLEQHDEMLARDLRRLDRHDEMLEEQKRCNQLIMSGTLQIMNHMIDGNHTDQLIESRDNMQAYLINR